MQTNLVTTIKNDKIILENVQRQATRLVKCTQHPPYHEWLRSLHVGLPSLEYRREQFDMVQVYKILHNIDEVDKNKLFQRANYPTTRGHSLKLFKWRKRLSVRANYSSQCVIDQWNAFPESIVTAPSVNVFKSRLNKFWKDHSFKFSPAC